MATAAVYDAAVPMCLMNSSGVDPLRNQMPLAASNERMKTKPDEIRESEVTPEALYLRRRDFLRAAAAVSMVAAGCLPGDEGRAKTEAPKLEALANVTPAPPGPFRAADEPTPFESASTYNNFYEFGTDKDDPAANANTLRPKPWTVAIEGEVAKPGVVPLETLLAPTAARGAHLSPPLRRGVVDGDPVDGHPARRAARRASSRRSRAKYVAFKTLVDPEQMPGQRREVLRWPYLEGLRMDEAMHPLTILAVGMYGRTLPNQNGAPLRLVVPWKYGFKSIKSIVKIRLPGERAADDVEPGRRRASTASTANVNPEVDHPRWSQAKERRIGEFSRRPTLLFNGYADQVASLYAGMDLRRNY